MLLRHRSFALLVELIFDLCVLQNRKHHSSGRIILWNAKRLLYSAVFAPVKSNMYRMRTGENGRQNRYGVALKPNIIIHQLQRYLCEQGEN